MARPLKQSERMFQDAVVTLAKYHGWMVFHPLTVQGSNGRWRTALQGDPGFPDLVLAHRDRGVIFAELKSAIGKVSDLQLEWIATLKAAGAEVYVWRPRDLKEVEATLSKGAAK